MKNKHVLMPAKRQLFDKDNNLNLRFSENTMFDKRTEKARETFLFTKVDAMIPFFFVCWQLQQHSTDVRSFVLHLLRENFVNRLFFMTIY